MNFHLHILNHTPGVIINSIYLHANLSCPSSLRMVAGPRFSGLSEAGEASAKVVSIRPNLIYCQRTLDKILNSGRPLNHMRKASLVLIRSDTFPELNLSRPTTPE